MAKVEYSALVERAAPMVWEVLKRFGQISKWHPAIPHSEIEGALPDGMVGCIRRLTLGDGTILRERLLSMDDSTMRFSYRFEESPLPVDNYVAIVRLIPLSGQDVTLITWSADFDNREPDPHQRQADAIHELIVGGHRSLQQLLANANANANV